MTLILRALRPLAHWLRRQPRLSGPLRPLVRSHPLLVRFGTWLVYSPLSSEPPVQHEVEPAAPIAAELGVGAQGGRLETDVLLARIRAELAAHEAGPR